MAASVAIVEGAVVAGGGLTGVGGITSGGVVESGIGAGVGGSAGSGVGGASGAGVICAMTGIVEMSALPASAKAMVWTLMIFSVRTAADSRPPMVPPLRPV